MKINYESTTPGPMPFKDLPPRTFFVYNSAVSGGKINDNVCLMLKLDEVVQGYNVVVLHNGRLRSTDEGSMVFPLPDVEITVYY